MDNSTNKWCGARFGMSPSVAVETLNPAWLISSVVKAIPISSLLLGRAAHFNTSKTAGDAERRCLSAAKQCWISLGSGTSVVCFKWLQVNLIGPIFSTLLGWRRNPKQPLRQADFWWQRTCFNWLTSYWHNDHNWPWYCGWKKSCTTLDGWNPTKNGINQQNSRSPKISTKSTPKPQEPSRPRALVAWCCWSECWGTIPPD